MAFGFAFLRNTCSTFSLWYWLGRNQWGRVWKQWEGEERFCTFFTIWSTESNPHASYLFLGYQKKQQSSGCSSLKVVEFHTVQSTIYSRYSRSLRLVFNKSFLCIITIVSKILSNDCFSCHSDLISAILKRNLRLLLGIQRNTNKMLW